jgi:hypothetical protein
MAGSVIMRKYNTIILLALALASPPLSTATALCMPSQGCNFSQQQSNTETQQRQYDSQRARLQQDQLEQQRAKTQILQTPQSQTTPLQRLEQEKQLRDTRDNVWEAQQDYWQSQIQLQDSRRGQVNH